MKWKVIFCQLQYEQLKIPGLRTKVTLIWFDAQAELSGCFEQRLTGKHPGVGLKIRGGTTYRQNDVALLHRRLLLLNPLIGKGSTAKD
jgi:hypothetical protein